MKISRVLITRVENHPQVKGLVSVIFDNTIKINLITILRLNNDYYIGMPTTKNENGKSTEVCYPTKTEFKKYLKDTIINAYLSKENDIHCGNIELYIISLSYKL